jgi:hypothetical protein
VTPDELQNVPISEKRRAIEAKGRNFINKKKVFASRLKEARNKISVSQDYV